MTYDIDSNLERPVDIKPAQLSQFISDKKGKDNILIPLSDSVITLGWMYKINPVYIWAHLIWETGWGQQSLGKNNLFGYGAFDDAPREKAWRFRNFDHCLIIVLSRIRSFYFDAGRNTLRRINDDEPPYATDPNWKNGICSIMNSIDLYCNKQI